MSNRNERSSRRSVTGDMEAGLGEQAVVFLQKAGQRAVERSASLDAIAHLTKALEILKAQPETSREQLL